MIDIQAASSVVLRNIPNVYALFEIVNKCKGKVYTNIDDVSICLSDDTKANAFVKEINPVAPISELQIVCCDLSDIINFIDLL